MLVALSDTLIAFDDSGIAERAWRGARPEERQRLAGVYVDPDVLRCHLGRTSLRLGERSPGSLLPVCRVCFPLERLLLLDASGPWPSLRVGWREKGAPYDERVLRPRGDNVFFEHPSAVRFERAVERLFALAAVRAWPGERDPGWVLHPDVSWEPTVWPSARRAGLTYRRAAGQRPVAQRLAPDPLAWIGDWLGSSPWRPWECTPREVVLTEAHIYARFADGRPCRLARSTLRLRLGWEDEAAVYIFGRRTPIVLPHRIGCRVRPALDRQLELRANAS